MYIPIVNVESRTVVGALSGVCVLSLPAGVEGVPPHIAIMTSQVADPTFPDQVSEACQACLRRSRWNHNVFFKNMLLSFPPMTLTWAA